MNALFVSNDPQVFDPASTVRARMREYAYQLSLTGGTLHFLSSAPRAVSEADGPLHLHGIRTSRLNRVNALARKAHALIISEHINVVSAQDPFEHGLAALRATKNTKARLHIQIHTDVCSPYFARGLSPAAFLNRARLSIMERVLPQAHGIRVVSKRVKDSVCARFNNRIVDPVIIPIAMSSSVPERVPMPGTVSPFTIIAVSRLEAEKRLEDVIDALVTVHKRHPEVGLVIVGSGRRERFLRAHAKIRGVAGAVTFLGARDDARGLMKSAQAFIQASAYEGYGVTLLEAALAEIPIITTDVGIVGDVLTSDIDVLVSPVGSVPTLIMHVETLVRDPQKRIMLTLNAARAAKEHLARTGDAPALIIKNLQAV